MRYLADTHLALWLIAAPERLSSRAKTMMENPENEWYLSLISVWEVALKHAKRPDRLPMSAEEFHGHCARAGLSDLSLELTHVYRAGALPTQGVHGDPFDRILLAQASCEDMHLVTHDSAFEDYHDEHVVLV